MVICLEQGADLHMAQLMPLSLTVSCFSKIQIGFTFLVPAYLDSSGRRAVKRVYNIRDDLSSLDLGIHEARDLVQHRPLWRLMSAQCYSLVVVRATIGLVIGQPYGRADVKGALLSPTLSR